MNTLTEYAQQEINNLFISLFALLFISFFLVILWVFQSAGTYHIARENDISVKLAWICWLPFGWDVVHAATADKIRKKREKKKSYFVYLSLMLMIFQIIGVIIILSSATFNVDSLFSFDFDSTILYTDNEQQTIIGLAFLVAASCLLIISRYIPLFFIYRSLSTKYMAMFIFSIICPLIIPILLYKNREETNRRYLYKTKNIRQVRF